MYLCIKASPSLFSLDWQIQLHWQKGIQRFWVWGEFSAIGRWTSESKDAKSSLFWKEVVLVTHCTKILAKATYSGRGWFRFWVLEVMIHHHQRLQGHGLCWKEFAMPASSSHGGQNSAWGESRRLAQSQEWISPSRPASWRLTISREALSSTGSTAPLNNISCSKWTSVPPHKPECGASVRLSS